MVTADVRDAALAVGRQSGFYSQKVIEDAEFKSLKAGDSDQELLISGEFIQGFTSEDWKKFASCGNVGVYGVTPMIKAEIVKRLRNLGQTVGITGCRAEDSLAFRYADVAISSSPSCDSNIQQSVCVLLPCVITLVG